MYPRRKGGGMQSVAPSNLIVRENFPICFKKVIDQQTNTVIMASLYSAHIATPIDATPDTEVNRQIPIQETKEEDANDVS